jgi:hypothetical protein
MRSYLKVVSPSGRTTRSDIFPFDESSLLDLERALRAAGVQAHDVGGRIVAWRAHPDVPASIGLVGETAEQHVKPTNGFRSVYT